MLHFQQPTHAFGILIQQTCVACINCPVHYHGIYDYGALSRLRWGPETWYTTAHGSHGVIVQGLTTCHVCCYDDSVCAIFQEEWPIVVEQYLTKFSVFSGEETLENEKLFALFYLSEHIKSFVGVLAKSEFHYPKNTYLYTQQVKICPQIASSPSGNSTCFGDSQSLQSRRLN